MVNQEWVIHKIQMHLHKYPFLKLYPKLKSSPQDTHTISLFAKEIKDMDAVGMIGVNQEFPILKISQII